MIQEGDRRLFPRRTFHDAAQAFHEGHHFEGAPEDISVGGMFLKTQAIDSVRPGDVLGILLDRNAGFEPPLFLYARVVRIRRNGDAGFGLRWERAGSPGTTDELADALELLLARPASTFRPHVQPASNGRLRSTYDFPRPAAAASAPSGSRRNGGALPPVKVRRMGEPPAPPRLGRPDSGPIGLLVSDEELDRLDVKVVHDSQSRQGRSFQRAFDIDAGIVESTPSLSGRPASDADESRTAGAFDALHEDEVTPSVSRHHHADRRVPVRIEGVMTVARIEVPVVVTGLAVGSAFVETPLAPLGPSARVGLRLDLPQRDDVHQMWLDCAVERVHDGEYGTPPGIELKIVVFEEPEQRDELARLVNAARGGPR